MNILSREMFLQLLELPFIQPVYPADSISSTLFNSSTFAAVASSTYSSRYNVKYLFNTKYANGGHDSGFDKIWESGSGGNNVNPWVKFTSPYKVKLTSIAFDFRVEFSSRVPKAVTIYGGDSNNSWVQILPRSTFVQDRTTIQTKTIKTPDYYYGYYLYFDGSGGTGSYSVTEIANLNLTGTYEEII